MLAYRIEPNIGSRDFGVQNKRTEEILGDELRDLGVSLTERPRQLDAPPDRISEIIRGCRAITGDTALRLGHGFGATPQFWPNLQTAYDLRLAAEQAGEAIEKLPTRRDSPKAAEPP